MTPSLRASSQSDLTPAAQGMADTGMAARRGSSGLHHCLGFFRNNYFCCHFTLDLFLPMNLQANCFDTTIQTPGSADSANQVGVKPHTFNLVGPTRNILYPSAQATFHLKKSVLGLSLPEAKQSLECICMLLSKTKKSCQRWGKTTAIFPWLQTHGSRFT